MQKFKPAPAPIAQVLGRLQADSCIDKLLPGAKIAALSVGYRFFAPGRRKRRAQRQHLVKILLLPGTALPGSFAGGRLVQVARLAAGAARWVYRAIHILGTAGQGREAKAHEEQEQVFHGNTSATRP